MPAPEATAKSARLCVSSSAVSFFTDTSFHTHRVLEGEVVFGVSSRVPCPVCRSVFCLRASDLLLRFFARWRASRGGEGQRAAVPAVTLCE